MKIRGIGLSDMDWIHLAQDMYQWQDVVNTVMTVPVPKNVKRFLSNLATGGFSRTQIHGAG
jgi:hypothetical protein